MFLANTAVELWQYKIEQIELNYALHGNNFEVWEIESSLDHTIESSHIMGLNLALQTNFPNMPQDRIKRENMAT